MPQRGNKPAPEHPEQFESPTELFEPVSRAKDVLKFWKTLNAVIRQEPLYDYETRRLEEAGYQGPWHFNLTQSFISGLPGLIIPAIVHWANLSAADQTPTDTVTEALQSFALPFSLMLTAYAVGRASLWKADSTKAARERAARIFLYLDGAYGLWPQLFASAALSVFFLFPDVSFLRSLVMWVGICQLVIYMRTIPEQLFQVLGYTEPIAPARGPITLFSTEQQPPAETTLSRSKPPVWKFRICVLLVLPLISVAVAITVVLLSVLLHPLLRSLL